jgi:hypothetical protein
MIDTHVLKFPGCLSVVTNKARQGNRCGGPCEVPFLLKKSLEKTGGPEPEEDLRRGMSHGEQWLLI